MFRSKSLITINEPHSMVSESYKMLRTNLQFMNVDTNNQVLLFTSSFTEEGKTTSIVNTAITMAHDNKKVLLIECDLRKARIHELFAIEQIPGLTNCLADNKPFQKVITPIDEVPGLHVLTAGALPPNPAEVLGSNKMQKLIEDVKKEYDVILIDAPPVLSVTDAVILTQFVDGVILVVASKETKSDDLKKAKKRLDQVGAKVIGAIMTKADVKDKRYYNYYTKTS